MTQSVNESVMEVFVEQPLASPGSANDTVFLPLSEVTKGVVSLSNCLETTV